MTRIAPKDALAMLVERHRTFYAKGGPKACLDPMFMLFREDGENIAFAAPWGSTLEKDETAHMVRLLLRLAPDIYMAAFVSEAWTKTISLGELDSGLPPSQSEDRLEVVLTSVETRDGERLQDMSELVRDWKTGKVVGLKPLPSDFEKSEGRFVGLFG